GVRATGLRIVSSDGSRTEVRAKVVVDASGRACVIGRQLGLRSDLSTLRKASAWSYYRGGERLPGIDAGETTMFLIPGGGWFWCIPLPDDIVSVGIVADPEYLFSQTDDLERAFYREVNLCAPLFARLAQAKRAGPVRGSRQLAYLNRQTCGDGWVMIGDARAFLDPIFSSGVTIAVLSARLLATEIAGALREGRALALEEYWRRCEIAYTTFDRLIERFYRPEWVRNVFFASGAEDRLVREFTSILAGDVWRDDNDIQQKFLKTKPRTGYGSEPAGTR
ncbi:MAG TPA: tryptophan 7-halogenase, partial [Planctomycetota bacterium]|nr:tryptophan 7-halogenase [Planctomycetota bacterium]